MPRITAKSQSATPAWARQFRLNARQAAFVDQYLIDFNGTQAARRAGYSFRTARNQASALLAKPNIQQSVKHRLKDRQERVELDQDFVLTRLHDELTASLAELHDKQGVLKPVHDWPRVWQQGLVTDVDSHEERAEDGTITGYVRKVRLGDRIKRLELLMRHLGMLTDKVQVDASDKLLEAARAVTQGASMVRPGGLDLGNDGDK